MAPSDMILLDGDEKPPRNPTALTYPATLPVEVAMRTDTIPNICESYGLTRDDWAELRLDPLFIADVGRAAEMLHKEGMSFKMKAQLQAEELLNTSWQIIQNKEMPAAVRADLIKFTVRCAGLEGDPKAGQAGQNNLQINISLG